MARPLDSATPGDNDRAGPAARGDDLESPAFRRRLSASVASAAGPYGYTISLGGSIAMATQRLGSPHLAGALLLMAGAVVAFVALGVVAQGSIASSEPLAAAPPTVWDNAHIPSAGLALCSVWGVDHASGMVGWWLTGFAATAVYLLVCAAQQAAIAALRRPRHKH